MLNEIWVIVFSLIKSITGDVDVKGKGTLQKQVDDCFQSASDGKKLVADAVTGKGVPTGASDTFAAIAANIKNIKTSANLQAKNAALSTAAQTIKADTGYDGLSQVSVPAVSGNAGTGDVLSGKTFNSATAGIGKTGTMTNRGAWTGATTGNGNVAIPAGYHNGSGYVSGAGAYNKGVSDADGRANVNSSNYKTGYNAGVSDTKKGTAGAGDVLTGKTFTNASSVGASGTMANKGDTTVDASAVTQDDNYAYMSVPANGFYNMKSKLRASKSNLIAAGLTRIVNTATKSASRVTSFSATIGEYYIIEMGTTVNNLASDTFFGCSIVFDSFEDHTGGGVTMRSRMLIVKATSNTITINCPHNHNGYYYAQITS